MRQIDADGLKEHAQKLLVGEGINTYFGINLYKMFEEIIDKAPTVAINCKDCDGYEAGYSAGLNDAERPKGKWIGECYDPECDQCHTKPLEEFCDSLGLDGGSYVSIPMFFCPNCGADMRKGGERE